MLLAKNHAGLFILRYSKEFEGGDQHAEVLELYLFVIIIIMALFSMCGIMNIYRCLYMKNPLDCVCLHLINCAEIIE